MTTPTEHPASAIEEMVERLAAREWCGDISWWLSNPDLWMEDFGALKAEERKRWLSRARQVLGLEEDDE